MTTIASSDAFAASAHLLDVLNQLPDIGSARMGGEECSAPLHLAMIVDDVPALVSSIKRNVTARAAADHMWPDGDRGLFEAYVFARLGRIELATAVAAADSASVLDLSYLLWIERVIRPAADYLGRLANAVEDHIVEATAEAGWPG